MAVKGPPILCELQAKKVYRVNLQGWVPTHQAQKLMSPGTRVTPQKFAVMTGPILHKRCKMWTPNSAMIEESAIWVSDIELSTVIQSWSSTNWGLCTSHEHLQTFAHNSRARAQFPEWTKNQVLVWVAIRRFVRYNLHVDTWKKNHDRHSNPNSLSRSRIESGL